MCCYITYNTNPTPSSHMRVCSCCLHGGLPNISAIFLWNEPKGGTPNIAMLICILTSSLESFKHFPNASMGVERTSSSHMLLIKCTKIPL